MSAHTSSSNVRTLTIVALLAVLVLSSVFLYSYKEYQDSQPTASSSSPHFRVEELSFPRHSSQKAPRSSYTSPYGFSIYNSFTPQTVSYLKQLGVVWIRFQIDWQNIEPQPNQFRWSTLDATVALANANGFHITFPIQQAPYWAKTQMCANIRFLPGVSEITQFAMILAQRYNGQSGHGYIDSYEVGNEEYDNTWTGNWNTSIACRQPSFYGPTLKSVYTAIKQVSPKALVGMFGLWWANTAHIVSYMQQLYQNGYGAYFDFANYHYYICNDNPSALSDDHPTFDGEWQAIYQVMQQYHDENKPIWVTETGWNISGVDQATKCIVTPAVQAKYMSYVLGESMNSHVIQHVFWYTIDRGADGMSISQPQGVLPSFYTLKNFIQKNQQWN